MSGRAPIGCPPCGKHIRECRWRLDIPAIVRMLMRWVPEGRGSRESMRRVAGIDVGGTFTDLLLYEAGPEGSRVHLAKIPTTAPNQADGVLAAIAQAGVRPSDRTFSRRASCAA